MYYILENAVLDNKNRIKYYRLKDSTGNILEYKRDIIKEMLLQGIIIQGLYLDKLGRVRRKYLESKTLSASLNISIQKGNEVYTKDLLEMKPRNCVRDIVKFCKSNISDRVYILYGLRRTGKTVAMKHSILELARQGIQDNVYLITIEKETTWNELLNTLNNIKNSIVFIDEITRITDIVDIIHVLSDRLSGSNNIKFVLTGTDSYVFFLANNSNLFGRAFYSHSTLLPYYEYKRVASKDLQEYIKDGTLFGSLYSESTIINRINSMIIANVILTLKRNTGFIQTNPMYESLAKFDLGELGFLVYTVLASAMQTKYTNNINSDTVKKLGQKKLGLLATACQLDIAEIPSKLTNIKVSDMKLVHYILSSLDITKDVKNLTNFVLDPDIYKSITDQEVCITQPGLLWAVLKMLGIRDDAVKGIVTENTIIASVYMLPKNSEYAVLDAGYLKYEYNNEHHEIDVVLRIGETSTASNILTLIEVKHSNKQKEDYKKHLISLDIKDDSYKKINKLIIYTGNTSDKDLNGIRYINIEEFLLNPWNFIV